MIAIDLSGKHAIVTGGTAGIGAASAQTLADAGARVTVLSRRASCDDKILADPRISFRSLDVAQSKAVTEIIAAIDRELPIDIAVLNAGRLAIGRLADTDDATWRDVMAVNVDGLFYTARAVIRALLAGGRPGRIVMVGSISGIGGHQSAAAYCASKAVTSNFARQAAVDYASHGIAINCVAPGFVDTEMTADHDQSFRDLTFGLTPNKRWATAQQIANAILFLSSDLSNHIHGETVVVDGGWQAGLTLVR